MFLILKSVIYLLLNNLVRTIVYIVCLTMKRLKAMIKQRLQKKVKVAFGHTVQIFKNKIKEIIEEVPSMSISDMYKICKENPYFIIDYDDEIDEISDFQTIKTSEVENNIKKIINNEGIVVFN